MRTRLIAAVLLLALVTACAPDAVSPAIETTPTSASPTDQTDRPTRQPSTSTSVPSMEVGTKIIAHKSDFGTILFDATGQAIYLFDVEDTTKPRCYGACAAAWPPVITDAAPVAGQRVEQSLLGTTDRTDSKTQVTYDGHPLYFYAHEGKHEVKCHDIFLNGGTWYAVQPNGDPAP